MKTNYDDVKDALSVLGIESDKLEQITAKDARIAYHRRALEVHPDKADPDKPEQKAEFNAAFQALGNAYERILKYIVEKLQSQKTDIIESTNDETIFTKEKFGKFNFPFENNGSFTVHVEDKLAEAWQESFENVYGSPRVHLNENGVECDRMWKIIYQNIELTLHFYNHNKPKAKKQSKILVQGGVQSIICEYVFFELPKIYEMVSTKSLQILSQNQQKRKRIATPIKKRNIKHKPTSKLEQQSCALCDFTSVSQAKMIHHMKIKHTNQIEAQPSPAIDVAKSVKQITLVEDMSLCMLSDDEEPRKQEKEACDNKSSNVNSHDEKNFEQHQEQEHKEQSISIGNEPVPVTKEHGNNTEVKLNNKPCEESKSVGNTNDEFKVHIQETHTTCVSQTEITSKPPPFYKCRECLFTGNSTDELKRHRIELHDKEKQNLSTGNAFFHSCISCKFHTNNFNELNEHIDECHRDLKTFKCGKCDEAYRSQLEMEWHLETGHSLAKLALFVT